MFFLSFSLFYVILSFNFAPTPPLLPLQFSLPFHEWSIGGETTDGNWYYDNINDRGMEEHDNSSTVWWCSSTGLAGDYPCRIISEVGIRVITFLPPKEDPKCCFCCSTSTCGGIIYRNWLNAANFTGQTIVENQKCDIWTIKGNDDNWWYTNAKSGIPVRYTEKVMGKLYRNYTYHDITLGQPSDKLFELPLSCSGAEKCDGFCAKWRN